MDVLLIKENFQLSHTVYRKSTHTDRYLNKNSNHHPAQKNAVLHTLVSRAFRICNEKYLQAELNYLRDALMKNGYSLREINLAINKKKSGPNKKEKPESLGKAYLPYIKNVTDKIGKVLLRNNIQTIYLPTTKIGNTLRPVKDKRHPLDTPGVYSIPCSCGKVYIGETKRSVKTRLKEHERNIRLCHPENSAVAEHVYSEPGHDIDFNNTKVLAIDKNYYVRLNREAIEIYKNPNNYNRKDGLFVNRIWKPVLHSHQKQ